MKRILPILAWGFLILSFFPSSAQTVQPDFGAPAGPVNVCGGNAMFQVRINGSIIPNPDATLDVALPAGYIYVTGSATLGGGTGSVTELAHGANTATLRIQNIDAAPGYTLINYQAYATCSALGTSLTDNGQVSYTFSSASTLSKTTTSNSFNTQSASLSISNITNSSYFGASGDNYTRNINIINNGYGPVSQLTLADTSGPGLSIRGISVSGGWTIVTAKTLSGADTVTTFTLSGATLSQGQVLTLVENVSITSNCFLQSRFGSWFGCDGSACRNNNASGLATAGATVNNSFVPLLRIIPDLLPLTCRGSSDVQTIRVTNTGSVKANQLSLNLFSTASDLSPALQQFDPATSTWNQSGYGNFKYKLGVNGSWIVPAPASSLSFNTPAACLAGLQSQFEFIFPVVNPGDTLYITYNERFCPVTTPASGTIITPGTLVRFNYDAPCGGRTAFNSSLIRNPTTTGISTSPMLPGVMNQGTPYVFNYYFPVASSATYVNTAVGGSTVRFQLTLPADISFSGNAADLSLTNVATGSVIGVPSAFSYNAGTHVVSATFAIRPSFSFNSVQNAQLSFSNLLGDCLSTSGDPVRLNVFLRNNSTCVTEEWLLQNEQPVVVNCPVPSCPLTGGLNFSGFELKRTNIAQADNDNNGAPDAAGVADPSKVRYDLAMPGDTIRALFSGRVHVGAAAPAAGFTHGYAVDTMGGGYFTSMTGRVRLYATGSNTPFYSVNNLPVIAGSGYCKLDFSISSLNSALALPGGYTSFQDGDSIEVSFDYRVTGNPGSVILPLRASNHFFISDVTDPSAAVDQYSCNPHFPGLIRIAGYEAGTTGSRTYTLTGSGNVATEMDHYLSIGGRKAGSKPFVNEYRPLSVYQQLVYTIPAGSEYVSATASYSYTTGVGIVTTKTVAITPLSAGSNPLVFELGALFTNGTFTRGDQGSSLTTTVVIRPTCEVNPRSEAGFNLTQVATPGYNTGFPGHTINVKDSIYYIEPEMLVSTANTMPVATDNTVSWEVQVSNASVASALRVWMGKITGTGTINITSVQRLSGPGGFVLGTVTPVGTLYQLGTFAQTSNYYKINATYSGCTRDSLVLGYWYDCAGTGYPSTASAAAYKRSLTLSVVPLESSLQTVIVSEPVLTPKPDFCDVLPYEIETINSGSSSIHDLKILAGFGTGVVYAPGTLQLEYPAGSGSWVALADGQITVNASGFGVTIPNGNLPTLFPQDAFRVRFGLRTSCGFNSGESIQFQSAGAAFCGSPIVSTKQQSQQVTINGIPTDENIYTISSSTSTAVQDCVTGDITSSYHFSIINLGPLPTSQADGFNITLPPSWSLDVASVSYQHDPGGAAYTGLSGGAYQFTMGSGIAIGDSVVLTATIRIVPPVSLTLPIGNTPVITENGVVRYGGVCSSTGVACPQTEVIVVTHAVTTILFNGDRTNQPIFSIHDPAPVCSPASVNLASSAVTAGSSTGLLFTYFTDAAGTIVLSNPSAVTVTGTYYITATSVAGCTVTKPVNVTVNPLPVATISYLGSPFCNTGSVSVVLSGQTGGTFSSTAGLVIDPVTGGINLAASGNGTYLITYTFTNGTCPSTTTTTITIRSLPNLVIHNPAAVCAPLSVDLTVAAVTAGSDAGLTYSYFTDAAGTLVLANPSAVTVAGTYYIQAVAASGCSIISAVVVNVNPAPVATISYPGSPFCINGTSTVAVAMTGQAGGTYSSTTGLSINATTGTVNLAASTPGTYVVNYNFSNGVCPGTATTSIIITAAPRIVITNPAPACSPAMVDITVPGITAGSDAGLIFTYYTNAAGTNVLPNPTAISVTGTYYIQGTSASGCKSAPMPVTVTINPLPVATIAYPASPYCQAGVANVVITGQAGGTFSSTPGLSINGASGAVNPGGSTAGTYIVTYNFSNGSCTNTTTTTIVINANPLLLITDPASVCIPQTVDITLPAITAGSDPGLTLSYYSNAAATLLIANPTSISISGTYYIMAENAAGCRSIMAVHVVIAPLPVATINYPGSPFCHSGNAAVVITGQGGGTFSAGAGLLVNATTGEIDLAGSTPGTYTVTYTFSNASCTNTGATSVIIQQTPVLVITDPAPVCAPATINLTNASVTSGSTAGLSYNYYTNSAGTTVLTTPSSVSVSGTYYIQGVTTGGCHTAILPVTVVVNPLPVATISYPGSPFCAAAVTPVVPVQTGQAGGTYSSTPGLLIYPATGVVNIAGSTPGTYIINYHFTNGLCENDATTTIVIEPTPVLVVHDPAAVCEPSTINLTSGAVTAGSTSGLSFAYFQDAAGAVPVANPSAVSTSGTYYIIGTTAAGCVTSTEAVTVTINPMPAATINYPGSPICYASTGALVVDQTGQAGGLYSAAAGLAINNTNGEVNLGSSTPGTYTVNYKFSNGLCENVATTQIIIQPKPVLVIKNPQPVCEPNAVNLSQPAVTAGSTPGLSFAYYADAAGTILLPNPSAVAISGTYYIRGMFMSTGCVTEILPVAVTISDKPSITVNGAALVCKWEEVILTATSAGNSITWPGLGVTGNDATVYPQSSGDYTAVATNAAGCTATATVTVQVRDFNMSLTANPNPVMPGTSVTLTSGANATYNVIGWLPAPEFTTQTGLSQNFIVTKDGLEYTVIGRSVDGCIDTASIVINIEATDKDFYIPNAFSPNNDGKNDVFKVYGSAIRSVELRVFNQWGELVFESFDKDKGWDGTFKGKIQPVGVYPFGVKVTFLDNRVITKRGTVNLIR